MNIELPKLVLYDLFRNAYGTIEKMTRSTGDRSLHAWALKQKRMYGGMMLEVASSEVDEEDEESIEQRRDEEFYG